MKLVFFINSLSTGGAERVISKLANFFADQGHEVTLLTLTGIETDYYQVSASVRRVSLNAGQLSKGPVSALTNNLRRIAKTARVFRRLRPDCIVAFMPTANVLAVIADQLSGRAGRTRVIVSERVHPEFTKPSRARDFLKRTTYPRATQTVVLSVQTAQWLQDQQNIRNSKVIPNGIALPLARQKPTVEPADLFDVTDRIILLVGRISDQKQPMVALSAFDDIAESLPDWHLVYLGSGDLNCSFQQALEAARFANRIHHIKRAGNVADWYERADLFLSTAKYEGSPNALMEAMAHGCPVIAFDCPTGPADLIRDGENGLLLPLAPTSTQSKRLSQAIRTLTADATLRKRLAKSATHVCESHSEQQFFGRWSDLILGSQA
jgi:glycosyltransferase involved in cell wall biosynthesis